MTKIVLMPNVATAEMLFQLYYSGDPKEVLASKKSETRDKALDFLIKQNLIDEVTGNITERGTFWVKAVLQLPLPHTKEIFYIPTDDCDEPVSKS